MAVFATLTNQAVDMRTLWPDAGGSNITAVDPPFWFAHAGHTQRRVCG